MKKIKKIDPHCRGQYVFICFAHYGGDTLIVFHDADRPRNYAEKFDNDSVFVPFEQEDEMRFDIIWQD